MKKMLPSRRFQSQAVLLLVGLLVGELFVSAMASASASPAFDELTRDIAVVLDRQDLNEKAPDAIFSDLPAGDYQTLRGPWQASQELTTALISVDAGTRVNVIMLAGQYLLAKRKGHSVYAWQIEPSDTFDEWKAEGEERFLLLNKNLDFIYSWSPSLTPYQWSEGTLRDAMANLMAKGPKGSRFQHKAIAGTNLLLVRYQKNSDFYRSKDTTLSRARLSEYLIEASLRVKYLWYELRSIGDTLNYFYRDERIALMSSGSTSIKNLPKSRQIAWTVDQEQAGPFKVFLWNTEKSKGRPYALTMQYFYELPALSKGLYAIQVESLRGRSPVKFVRFPLEQDQEPLVLLRPKDGTVFLGARTIPISFQVRDAESLSELSFEVESVYGHESFPLSSTTSTLELALKPARYKGYVKARWQSNGETKVIRSSVKNFSLEHADFDPFTSKVHAAQLRKQELVYVAWPETGGGSR